MCRLRRNELYRLKFRKKFVKNGQEEIYAREGGGYPRAHACEYVSRRLQTTLYICRRREICLMTENREKRSVASSSRYFAHRVLFSFFFLSLSLFFCKPTRFSGAFFRLFPRCLIRGTGDDTFLHIFITVPSDIHYSSRIIISISFKILLESY